MPRFTIELTADQIESLQHTAQRQTWQEQCDANGDTIDHFAGGNVDDAYNGGTYAGEIEAARQLLTLLGLTW